MLSTLESPKHPAVASTPFSRGAVFADQVMRQARPRTLLRSAHEAFGRDLVLTTAFGLEGSVLVDMVGRLQLPIRIVTLDTGLFFQETYAAWRRLEARYGLHIEAVRPRLDLEQQAEAHGEALWERAPDRCCAIRKVEPLRELLGSARAWITGVRRAQTMFDDGYPSIGCSPCTSRVEADEDPRAGRWRGHAKRECGLHWDNAGRLVRIGEVKA